MNNQDIINILRELPNTAKNDPNYKTWRWLGWIESKKQYPYYATVLKEYDPKTILEIGTCLGYFLVTANYALPNLEKISWIDNETYAANSNQLAKENIEWFIDKYQQGKQVDISYYDHYPEINNLINKFDMIHIDGEHSYDGCLRDLEYSIRLNPKIIIGHDYNVPEYGVKKAVDFWCNENKLEKTIIKDFQYGLYIINL